MLLLSSFGILVIWSNKLIRNDQQWEDDFLSRDIFPKPTFNHMSLFDFNQFNKSVQIYSNPQVVIYSVGNSGSDGKYTTVRNFLSEFNSIKILVHLSDEHSGDLCFVYSFSLIFNVATI